MPVTVTFDIERPTPLELNRLRSAFIRLGWEHLGNTAYRYPRRRSHSCRGLQRDRFRKLASRSRTPDRNTPTAMNVISQLTGP